MTWARRVTPALTAAGSIALACAGGAAVLAAAGASPQTMLRAAAVGAFGDTYAIAETITRAVPLALGGAAVSLAFRAGVLNIGAEGQILAGAAAAVGVGLHLHGVPGAAAVPLVLLASCAGGACAAAAAAALRRRRAVPEVLSTILINFIMLQATSWLVRGPLQEHAGAYPQSDPIAETAMLPRLWMPTRLHLGAVIAPAVMIVLWIFLMRTAAGFRLRAVGANPDAARFARFPAASITSFAMAASGALAGLAGGIETTGLTGRLYGDLAGGAGYVSIAVALLGRLHPFGVAAAALAFGALESVAVELQRSAGVSAAFAQVIEAAALCAMLAGDEIARRVRLRADARSAEGAVA